jgi:predicted nucleic acid-binding Zn finger protein
MIYIKKNKDMLLNNKPIEECMWIRLNLINKAEYKNYCNRENCIHTAKCKNRYLSTSFRNQDYKEIIVKMIEDKNLALLNIKNNDIIIALFAQDIFKNNEIRYEQ